MPTRHAQHTPSLFHAAGTASPAHPAAIAAARSLSATDRTPAQIGFAVLASSSAGNASVLRIGSPDNYRLILIDAGLSPKKTQSLLASIHLDSTRIDHLILTHLHRDHIHKTWLRALPRATTTWIPRAHARWAERTGLTRTRTELFDTDGATEHQITRGISLSAIMAPHDYHGSALLKLTFPPPVPHQHRATLGYATDLGAVPDLAPDFFNGVDVLALESNYHPPSQRSSGRHPILIERVMGGAGHLSNDEAAALAANIAPRRHLVLLHLSRQCNTPQRAIEAHQQRVECSVHAAAHDRVTGPYELFSAETSLHSSTSSNRVSHVTT